MDTILLVDDTVHADQVRRALYRASDGLVIHARDEAAMVAALDSGRVRLLVTEYALKWACGLELLVALGARYPGMPVIICTGSGSEVVAVDALRAGAADYVTKTVGGLARLVEAVQDALGDKPIGGAVGSGAWRYRDLFNAVPIGLYRTATDGAILEANPALIAMLGYPDRATFLRARAVDIYVDPRDRERCLDILAREGVATDLEFQMRRHDGRVIWVRDTARAVRGADGAVYCYEGALEDITERVIAVREREALIGELRQALAKVDTLQGLLPICANCKRIRDDEGDWQSIEAYVSDHSRAQFTHGLCPECINKLYPGFL